MATPRFTRRLAAIFSSDVVGYSRLMREDDVATVAAIVATRKLIGRHVRRYAGRVVDSPGDALLADFRSATEAVRCAVAVQKEMLLSNARLEARRRMRIRIGLDVGDVIERDAALYGQSVNVAARLQALAHPDGICISGAIRDQIESRLELPMTFAGEQKVKNIAQAIRVFHISVFDPKPEARDASLGTSVADSAARTNLPAATVALLGRDADLTALMAELSRHRLVTLLGAGGIGKTRLAQAAALASVAVHPDGVWWVDLSAVSDPSEVAPAVANAVGLQLGKGEPGKTMAQALGDRHLLLVLDNCEHVAAMVAEVVQASLSGAPNLRVLATSQESLLIREERIHRLEPLGLPPPDATLEDARRFGAVQLLEARAQAVDRTFALSEGTAATAIEICRRLDGIALAIEMAASRIPVLGLTVLSARLADRLQMLKAQSRSAPSRHQTLRATLDWSHSLLTPGERAVLRRLAVFAGSFRLDTAQLVACRGDIDEWAYVDLLTSLVAKSLVHVEQLDPPRYRLLETTKLYALERLAEAGEQPDAEVAHGQAMAVLGDEAIDAFWSLPDEHVVARYFADDADIQIAFDRACARRDPTIVAAMGAVMAVLSDRSPYDVEQRRMAAACVMLPLAGPLDQAKLWNWFSWFDSPAIDGFDRKAVALESLAASRRIGDAWLCYQALWACSVEFAREQDWAGANRFAHEATQAERADWPPRKRARGLMSELAVYMFRGDAEGFRRRAQSCVALCEEAGAVRSAAWQRHNIADAALMAGDIEEAIRLEVAVIEELRRFKDDRRLCWPMTNLCAAHLMAGDLSAAIVAAREAVPHLLRMAMLGNLTDHLSLIAGRQGMYAEAGRLLGASDAWYARQSRPRQVNEARLADQVSRLLLETIGQVELDRHRAAGSAIGDEATVALAHRVLEAPAEVSTSANH